MRPSALALLVTFGAGAAWAAPPRVTLDSGVVEGAKTDGVAAFEGIPYAAPPVGPGRWQPPRPVAAWTEVRAARELGPSCAQSDRAAVVNRRLVSLLGGDPATVAPPGPSSEDCLTINVWTANLGGHTPQPVMVWLHGGSYAFGSGGDDAAILAPLGVVVVTLNYRLGVLGFLAHPALARESPHGSSGNYGLLDQIAALGWVQRNIAAFGGDPRRVTVFGHSAGGGSVLQLMASPLARGLFQRAVSQSGSNGEMRTRAAAEAEGLALATRIGAPPDDPLPALRAQSAAALVAISRGPFDPSVDGWVLPAPLPGAAGGDEVPLLLGATADEAAVFALPGDDAAARVATIRLVTARDFVCPAREVAAARRGRSWLYHFTAVVAPGPAGASLGAYHGADVRVLFRIGLGVPLGATGERVGEVMRRAWVRFATTGDPNGPGLAAWPPYDGREPRQLELGETIRVVPATAGCDPAALRPD